MSHCTNREQDRSFPSFPFRRFSKKPAITFPRSMLALCLGLVGNGVNAEEFSSTIVCAYSTECSDDLKDGDTITVENEGGLYMYGWSQRDFSHLIINLDADEEAGNYAVKNTGGDLVLSDSVINARFSDDIDPLNSAALGVFTIVFDGSTTLHNVDINVGSWEGADGDITIGVGPFVGISVMAARATKPALEATNTNIVINDFYGNYWTDNAGYSTYSGIGIRLLQGDVQYHGGAITVNGDGGIGIRIDPRFDDARDEGISSLYVDDGTKITVTGWGARGIEQYNGNNVVLGDAASGRQGADILVRGESSIAFTSASAGMTNRFSFANSTLMAEDNPDAPLYATTGIFLSGGDFQGVLDNTTVTADNALYVADHYSSTYDSVYQTFYTDDVNITVKNNSALTGNVRIDDNPASTTVLNMDFSANSLLNGAVNAYAGDSIVYNSSTIVNLSFDDTSRWTVTGSSEVDRLANAGNVIFADNDSGGVFNTLTVHEYVGGGNITFNADVSTENHGSNRLILDGASATPQQTTKVSINGKGYNSDSIDYGALMLVDAQNGAITAEGDFVFNAAASNYNHDGTDTVAIGAYNYNLVRGDGTDDKNDWYLSYASTSSEPMPTPEPDPTPDPIPDSEPVPNPEPAPIPTPSDYNVRPDAGAYLGNQLIAQSMFTTALHDRRTNNSTAGQGVSSGDDATQAMWMRLDEQNANGYSAAGGRIDFDVDSTVFQLGGDVLNQQTGSGRFILGVMGGYGHAKTDSHSKTNGQRVSADGKVDGYNAGLYGTWFADAEAKRGLYVNSWLQYSWFNNEVSGALSSSDKYDSTNWAFSVETGYAWQPVESLMVEPQAQAIFNRYDADDHYDGGGTRIRTKDSGGFTGRLGLRASGTALVQPYAEVSWWRHEGDNGVWMNRDSVSMDNQKNLYEAKLGIQGKVTPKLNVWAEASTRQGSGDFASYGGAMGVTYRW
ncbi:Outer membrane protein IcsA autotransporter precursor [Leminorella grimontii]|nr:Outer membrane protein IcsA autotransporter precursor [Leminorella grimontii]